MVDNRVGEFVRLRGIEHSKSIFEELFGIKGYEFLLMSEILRIPAEIISASTAGFCCIKVIGLYFDQISIQHIK